MSIERVGHITHKLANLFIVIGAIGLLIMTAIVSWQVFGRYVLQESPDWSEQTALVLMIWYVLFAAAAGVREGFHIRIEAFEKALPKAVGNAMRLFANVVVGLCGVAMLIWGTQLVIGTWPHVVPTLGISRGAVYIALPISGALIALFSVERIILDLSKRSNNRQETV
ncbi:MAG: TRAP transporter small permease [Acidiferrobacterales bacterium]|nr:TRAP transporter small permease [Acidiferrobacterales bacterium]